MAGGLCFAEFALMVLFATLVLLPVSQLLPGDRARRARRLASLGFRILLIAVLGSRLGEIRLEGRQWMASAPGRLIVANHPCFMDVVVMMSYLPEANNIMKDALRRNPFLALFVRAGGYISNASDPLDTIAACRRAKERGEALIVFPEGSRTHAGEIPRFRRGAAQIALRAEMEILPVTLSCSPPVLTHGRPWYAMPSRRVQYVISFHAPREPAAFASIEGLPPSLAARRVTRGMETWFKRQLRTMKTSRIEPVNALRAGRPDDAALHAGRPRR
ncbi:MAG: lysophospholipid acyltransferase family protein [Gammaproteobacteria bacterium]